MKIMSDKIHVIVMVPSPLTPRWLNNFCIDSIAEEFIVEYWDCSAICAIKFDAAEIIDRPYIKTISSLNNFETLLKGVPKDAIMISHIHLEADNYKVHKLISKYNKYRVYFNFWSNAITENLNLDYDDVDKENYNLTYKNRQNIFRQVKCFLFKFRPFLYVGKYLRYRGDYRYRQFVSIERQKKSINKSIALYDTEFVIDVLPRKQFSINHPDYENFLMINRLQDPPLVNSKYVVFLDSFFPFHPHLKTEDPNIDFDSLVVPYFASLNKFFDKIEKQYNCEVVIAAHPSAKCMRENLYGKRKVFYNKSVQLVKDSIAVCMHASYSIAYPILFNKPISLMSNIALQFASNPIATLNVYSKVFRIPIVDIDKNPQRYEFFTSFPPQIRQGYINMFFDVENQKLNSELVPMHIRKIHQQIIQKLSDEMSPKS